MPEGPFGGPRPFANQNRTPIHVHTAKATEILQIYVNFLSDKYDVEPPTVKIWDDDVWIQVVIDPDTVEANYDNITQQINLNERDIKFQYVIHEFAHHLSHVSDDIELVVEDLIDTGETDPHILEGMNELQTEGLATKIANEKDVRNNWNQVVALGIGVGKAEI